MPEVSVQIAKSLSPAERETEIVERKGLGHPDSICDAVAEHFCVRLCRYCLEHFGQILHHNVDKVLLCGGVARPAFGGGDVLEPIEMYLAGRATQEHRGVRIPLYEIAEDACREWLASYSDWLTATAVIPTGQAVPDLRGGAGASHGDHRGARERRAPGHDPPLLGQRRPYGFRSCSLAYPEYLRFQQARRAIDETLRQTRLALAGHDWRKVQQLVDQIRIGRKELDANRALLDLAAKVYDAHDVSVFPFSRGLDRVFPRSDRDRTTLQNHVIAVLTRLEQEDSTFRRFYADRRRSFERLAVGPPHATAAPDRRDQDRVEIEAQRALDRGDLDQVERWVQPMLGRESQSLTTVATPRLASPGDLSASFPEETLRLAHRLGLASVRAEFDRESAAYLQCCCVWQATLPDRPLTVGTKPAPGCTCGHICPPDTSPALKDTLDLLIAHPFINSGGERYLPRFVAEDILVEEFPEDGRYNERAELPSALGLGRRAGLSRLEIEAALLHRGPEIVEHLSLDAQRFRLVCIPFDVYSRLAPGRHWGQQRLWTHFDGYQIWKAGKLRALVGGDVRYGGMYHLCSIGVDYEREEIVARFAVVRRERFADTGPDAA